MIFVLTSLWMLLASVGCHGRTTHLSQEYDPDEMYPEYQNNGNNGQIAFGVPVCSTMNSCEDAYSDKDAETCGIHTDCIELMDLTGKVPANVSQLSIRSSYFANLTYVDLKNFTSLTVLKIKYNDIAYIAPGSFQSQKSLKVAYGSTETSPVVNLALRDDPLSKRHSTVGTTLPCTENKIIDPEGNVMPVNEPGELLSRGYCVMLKYWGNEEKTRAAIDDSGWYHSGDIAVMDEDGFFKVVGRIKDLIIRGGENVYPTEVEAYLLEHPKIDNVEVIGVPDPRLGEEIAAWIKLKEGEQATDEEIKDFCKGNIAHFKIPRYIKFVEEYPVTITRKVQKFVMREEYAKELGLKA